MYALTTFTSTGDKPYSYRKISFRWPVARTKHTTGIMVARSLRFAHRSPTRPACSGRRLRHSAPGSAVLPRSRGSDRETSVGFLRMTSSKWSRLTLPRLPTPGVCLAMLWSTIVRCPPMRMCADVSCWLRFPGYSWAGYLARTRGRTVPRRLRGTGLVTANTANSANPNERRLETGERTFR